MKYLEQLKTNLFISTLKKCEKGSIKITDPDNKKVEINKTSEVMADIKINDWSIISNMIKNGDVGFASDYRDGKWTSTNLKNLFTFVIINDKTLSKLLFGKFITRFFENIKYSKSVDSYVEVDTANDNDFEEISGTESREMIKSGVRPPTWFMREEISDLLITSVNNNEKIFVE